eukprot:3825923-Pyramimonas_sp.AAC.1
MRSRRGQRPASTARRRSSSHEVGPRAWARDGAELAGTNLGATAACLSGALTGRSDGGPPDKRVGPAVLRRAIGRRLSLGGCRSVEYDCSCWCVARCDQRPVDLRCCARMLRGARN